MRHRPNLRSFTATFREGTASQAAERGSRLFKNVTIIKAGLGNAADRHFYPANVLKEAVEKGQFTGLRAYADHPSKIDETVQPERTIRDMVGIYDNIRFVREGERGGNVVGDLRVFRAHKWLSDTVDDLIAMDAADKIGISINGAGDTQESDMKEAGGPVNEVLNFRKLYSADIVTEAGAGGGFHTLHEAAREARERTPMTKTELLKKISEAAAKGNAAEVTKLTAQLTEATDAVPADKKSKPAKQAKPAAAPVEDESRENATRGYDEDDMEEGDKDEEDDDAEDMEEGADEEMDEAADDEDADEASEDAVPEADRARRVEGSLADKFRAGTKTRENALSVAKGPKNPAARGGATKGGGSQTRQANVSPGGRQKGRRYAETEGRTRECGDESLQQKLDEALQEVEDLRNDNKDLRGRLNLREKTDAARKISRGLKNLDAEQQRRVADKLVRECKTVADMQREVKFYETIFDGAASRVRESFADVEDDDAIEGVGARIREANFGGEGVSDLLAECGLPVKQ